MKTAKLILLGLALFILAGFAPAPQTYSRIFVGLLRVTGTGIQMEGNKIDLDADRDTSMTADTDDQVDFEVGGTDTVVIDATGLTSNVDIIVDDTLNIDDTDSVLSGTNTITPTYSYLQLAPVADVLTMTLGTGTDGDLLIVHNTVTTNVVIVDTGATAGGGNITLGLNDIATFIYGNSQYTMVAPTGNNS